MYRCAPCGWQFASPASIDRRTPRRGHWTVEVCPRCGSTDYAEVPDELIL